MLNASIINAVEAIAPPYYQESWDNTGVQVGSLRAECTGVLLCVDITPDIVKEAHDLGCNLIISHHPLLFKGLKRISGNSPVEESVYLAVKLDICIYSCHTAVDSTPGGVSYRMAQMLGAKPVKVLSSLKNLSCKASVIVNENDANPAISVFDEISNDVRISDTSIIESHTETSDPFASTTFDIKNRKLVEGVIPTSAVTTLHDNLIQAVGAGIKSFTVQNIDNCNSTIGLGVYALFDDGVTANQLVNKVKTTFNSPVARCTALPDNDIIIRRIAMCGGSGSEFISTALRMGAQAFITSDTRYHDFVDFQNEILIIDIGHFESEECTKQIFYDAVREKFPNFACYKSQIEKNPIKYI